MNKIKNIVFDLGGVVVDLDRHEAVSRFVSMGVKDAADMLDPYRQHGFFLSAEDGSMSADEFCNKIREVTGKDISYETIASGWLGFIKNVPQYKLDYIESLRKEYKVYLLSNTNPFVMEWAHSSKFSPSEKPIDSYFDKIYASCELKVVKPHREIFEMLINDSGILPDETLFLDDGKANVEAATALGFSTYQPYDGEDWRTKVDALLAE